MQAKLLAFKANSQPMAVKRSERRERMGTETPLSESHSASAARTGGPFTWQSVEALGDTFGEGRNLSRRGKESPPLFLEADSWPCTSLGQCDASLSHKNKWVTIQPSSGYLGMTSVLLTFNQVERLTTAS